MNSKIEVHMCDLSLPNGRRLVGTRAFVIVD